MDTNKPKHTPKKERRGQKPDLLTAKVIAVLSNMPLEKLQIMIQGSSATTAEVIATLAGMVHEQGDTIAQQRQEIEDSKIDPLTRLLRSGPFETMFQERLNSLERYNAGHEDNADKILREFARVTSKQDPPPQIAPVFVLIDLDGFKPVNDRHGHARGDEVLTAVGQKIKSLGREDSIVPHPYNIKDFAGRLGGDEFGAVIFGPANDPNFERQIRERFYKALNALRVDLDGNRRIKVRASIGTAVFGRDGNSFEELKAAADEAMYADKNTKGNTRNTIEYDPPLSLSEEFRMRARYPWEVIKRWTRKLIHDDTSALTLGL